LISERAANRVMEGISRYLKNELDLPVNMVQKAGIDLST